MKKLIMAVVAVSFIWVGAALAAADAGNVAGEVTKVEGEMVTIKAADGTTKWIYNISGHRNVSSTACPGPSTCGANV